MKNSGLQSAASTMLVTLQDLGTTCSDTKDYNRFAFDANTARNLYRRF